MALSCKLGLARFFSMDENQDRAKCGKINYFHFIKKNKKERNLKMFGGGIFLLKRWFTKYDHLKKSWGWNFCWDFLSERFSPCYFNLREQSFLGKFFVCWGWPYPISLHKSFSHIRLFPKFRFLRGPWSIIFLQGLWL